MYPPLLVRVLLVTVMFGTFHVMVPLEFPTFRPRLVAKPRASAARDGRELATSLPAPEPRPDAADASRVDDDDDDDYARDADADHDDSEWRQLLLADQLVLAPPHLVGSANVAPGTVLVSRDRSATREDAFVLGTAVLMFDVAEDAYRGLVVNRPLSAAEAERARRALRRSDSDTPVIASAARDGAFWGAGGPVHQRHQWFVVHERADWPGAVALGPELAVGGDGVEVLLASGHGRSGRPVLVLYGLARWLPGQLEREIRDGLWAVSARRATRLRDVHPVVSRELGVSPPPISQQ